MRIFLPCESVTTPFGLCLLLSAWGILTIFCGEKESIQSFAKPPVYTLAGDKHRALGEAGMDTVAPVMITSCQSPRPLCADQTEDTGWNLSVCVSNVIRVKGFCYQLLLDLKQRSRHKWLDIFQWDSESELSMLLPIQRISSYFVKEQFSIISGL